MAKFSDLSPRPLYLLSPNHLAVLLASLSSVCLPLGHPMIVTSSSKGSPVGHCIYIAHPCQSHAPALPVTAHKTMHVLIKACTFSPREKHAFSFLKIPCLPYLPPALSPTSLISISEPHQTIKANLIPPIRNLAQQSPAFFISLTVLTAFFCGSRMVAHW